MKTLKRIFASTLLILAICVPLYAGEVNMPAAPCSGSGSGSDCKAKSSDETLTPPSDATPSAETTSPETSEFAVDLLLALLSLF